MLRLKAATRQALHTNCSALNAIRVSHKPVRGLRQSSLQQQVSVPTQRNWLAREDILLNSQRRSVMSAASAKDTPDAVIMKSVLVPISTGCEEMEAVIIIDVLRRAGALVTVASVEPVLEVLCSRGVKLVADCLITACAASTYDLIVLPGGMPGAERLNSCATLAKLLQQQVEQQRMYAAICASPAVVFESQGLLKGKKATAHPAFSARLGDQSSVESRVVVDGLLTTSRGPGTAFEFALSLVDQLYGPDKAKAVASPMVM